MSQRMGQSAVEYAILVGAAVVAVMAMSNYVQRAFDSHAEQIQEEQSPSAP